MKTKKIYSMCVVITLVSFLGFLVENIWLVFTKGYMDNRNMHLPFLFGYGLAVALIYFLFGTPDEPKFLKWSIKTKSKACNILIYYLIACLCVMVGEILLGTAVEALTGIVWWNYSNIPLHITKYTSAPTTLAFGLMITVFMKFIFLPLYGRCMKTENKWFKIAVCAIMTLMTVDFIFSGIYMFTTHELMELWRIGILKYQKHIEFVRDLMYNVVINTKPRR